MTDSVDLDSQPTRHQTAACQPNEGIDYVITFGLSTSKSTRAGMEERLTTSLHSVTEKLNRAELRYTLQPGTQKNTLFILVHCPEEKLQQALHRERIQDVVLGIHGQENAWPFSSDTMVLSKADRLRLVYDILTLPESHGGIGISSDFYPEIQSVFPLHDDSFNHTSALSWSRKWRMTEADLDMIREHFGEKIAFYFAFLQSYLFWLIPLTVLGVGTSFVHTSGISILYSLCVLLWSLSFTEVWKKKEDSLSVRWGVHGCSKHDPMHTPFLGSGDEPIRQQTGALWRTCLNQALSVLGVAFGAINLGIIVALVFIIQIFFQEYYAGYMAKYLQYAPTLVYALLVPTISQMYTTWVKYLTNREAHDSDAARENAFTHKVFIANFIVAFLPPLITAWVYIPFGDHALPYLAALNINHEHKGVDFQRLQSQVVYLMATGQVVGFFTEMILPVIMKYVTGWLFTGKKDTAAGSPSTDENNTTRKRLLAKIQKESAMPTYSLYMEFVEMVIQFGYVSMFSAVWPMAALCCLINNWFELRGDAIKLCTFTQRPVPRRADSIGAWRDNMESLAWFASLSMASFAYLFHPSTNLHSPHTLALLLSSVFLGEHIHVLMRFVVRYVLNLIPTPADDEMAKSEYQQRKQWAARLLEKHPFTKTDVQGFQLSSLWDASQNEPSQLIQDMLKVT